jgi:D-alanyl-D-alanine dipeptidase
MFNKQIKSVALFSLTCLFLAGTFLVPISVSAVADTCSCYSNDKDCKGVPVPAGSDSDKGCESLCKTEIKKSFNFSKFGVGTIGQTNQVECDLTHSAWIKTNTPEAEKKDPKVPSAFITPKLNVDIPGLSFSKPLEAAGSFESSFLSDYITAMYKYLISISTIIAIVMVMIGGLQYVLAGGHGDVGKAKERIKNAVIGLVLLLSVYLILYLVNPQLTLLKSIKLETIQEVKIAQNDGYDPNAPDICGKNIQTCKDLCAKDKSLWPKSGGKAINPNLTKRIPNSPGIKNIGAGVRGNGTPALIDALNKAGNEARTHGSDYLIKVGSAYRPLQHQIKLACDAINKGLDKDVGKYVAWPGGSPHGSGISVDLILFKGKTQLTSSFSSSGQKDPKWKKENSVLLDNIMTKAGFVRYNKEMWHYDLAGKASSYCRCSHPNCNFPPSC